MDSLLNESLEFDDLDLEEEEEIEEGRFKTALFGGYSKRSVHDYVDNLEHTIEQMQRNLESQIKELLTEKEALHKEKTILEGQFQKVDDHRKQLEEEYQLLEEKYKQAEIMLEEQQNLQEIHAALQAKYKGALDENDELVKKYKELETLFVQIQEEKEMYAQQLEVVSEQLNKANDIIGELERERDEKIAEISERDASIQVYKEKLEESRAHQKEFEEKLKEKIHLLDKTQEELRKHKEEVSRLKEENQYFTAQMDEKEEKQKNLSSEPEENTELLKKSLALMEHLYQTVEVQKDEKGLEREHIQTIEDIQEEISRLKSDLMTLKSAMFQEFQRQQEDSQNHFRKQLDTRLSPIIRKIDALEKEKNAVLSDDNTDYDSLFVEFQQAEEPEDISDLYQQLSRFQKIYTNPGLIPEKNRYESNEQAEKANNQELERRIDEMYRRISQL